jgi:hypothetical protein
MDESPGWSTANAPKLATTYGPRPYTIFPEPEAPEDTRNPLFLERFERDLRRYLEGATIHALTGVG